MFPRAVRVLRVRGVDIRLDPTWVVIAAMVGWTFLTRFSVPGRTTTGAATMAIIATLGFFGSVLAHELGHAFEARHRDLQVHGITLFLFGGVTEMDMHTHRPRDEFTVAAIGPYTSLVLASVFGLAAAALDWYLPTVDAPAAILGLLGWINLFLALFNVVPGMPLDGGRVLRAGLWAVTGDRERARVLSAHAGQLVATVVWVAGLWVLRYWHNPWPALWLAVIGLFMFVAAHVERRQARAVQRSDDREDPPAPTRAHPRTPVPEPDR